MSSLFEKVRIVQAEEIDQLGHVNNLVYLRWALDAAMEHSIANGWPFSRYEALGAGWVVRSHQITYLRSAKLGDVVNVRSWIGERGRATCRRHYRMTLQASDSEIPLVEAWTDWVFVDFAKQSPKRIPIEVLESFPLWEDKAPPPTNS